MGTSATDPVSDLRAQVEEAARSLRGDGYAAAPALERPPKPEFGDYSSNAAMLLAPAVGAKPRDVAEQLAERLGQGHVGLASQRVRVEAAGGTMTIASIPGEGTRIEIRVPSNGDAGV